MLGILFAALLVAMQAVPAEGPSAEAVAIFKQAAELQEAGKLEQAAERYRAFLALQPRSVEALSNLGVVYAGLGRYDAAIAEYRKALELSYLNAPIRMNLALAYYKSSRCAEALPEFETVLTTNPRQSNVILLESDCLMQMGQYARAVALLAPLETAMQQERVFNYLYGMALLQNKQTAAGLKQIDRIMKDGDSAEAHLMLGLSQRTAGDLAAAREEFRKAVAINPGLPLVHSLYGQALLSTGDREGARTAFLQELSSNPGDFDSNLYLGVILKEEQKLDEAERYFARALQLRPGDPGVRFQLATVHLGRNENDKALALLEPLVNEAPRFTEAHVSLATVYYRLKRKEDGDRERAAAAELSRQAQDRQPGASPSTVTPEPAGTVPPAPQREQNP
jgi:tetratricopeptide (TPR) repeat protein